MFTALKCLIGASVLAVLRLAPAPAMSHLMFLLRSRPEVTDRWGYHIRAIHYYEPLPNFRQIAPQQLQRRRVSSAVDFKVPEQLALLRRLADSFSVEIARLGAAQSPVGFDFSNPYFSGLDASTYYALIRDLKPSLVVEIGSGFSTQIAAKALACNEREGKPGRLVCIEPFAEPRLTESGARFKLVRTAVQEVPQEFFDQLTTNDILFIDSSHVATACSDVCTEFLEILPRLRKGVWVHIHDVFFPTDYPAEWVIGRRIAFNEQYILEAFLAFNSAYSVQLANSWMWHEEKEAAHRLCPAAFGASGVVALPGSFWMKRVE